MERVVFTKGGNEYSVLAKVMARRNNEDVDDLLDRADSFVFRFRVTDTAKQFFSSIDGMTCVATRAMPERQLSVLGAMPQPDRMYIEVTAAG